MNYDVIGDVHGQYDKLVALLRTLGYRETMRAWRHPDRTAIFVGDFIDRGPKQVETLKLVRGMVDTGAAMAVMGNHEFNAIAWATRDPEHPTKYLRSHDRPGNRKQHQAFLAEVAGKPLHAEIIEWFKTLPLWLDLGGIRVVHACWNDEYIDRLRPHLDDGRDADRRAHRLEQPGGLTGRSRPSRRCARGSRSRCRTACPSRTGRGRRGTRIRIRWWDQGPRTYRKVALAPARVLKQLPEVGMPADPRVKAYSGPPVFFGHYGLTSRPGPLAPRIACVDYNAADDGALVAYRWGGETELAGDALSLGVSQPSGSLSGGGTACHPTRSSASGLSTGSSRHRSQDLPL